ncbi:MAG TPA: GNAT family N-acetyltransferase [Solirubrobacteraceae bacterium]
MSGDAEIREEPADGPVARVLFEEYLALVRDRIGPDLVPSERIFATADGSTGSVWLVIYDGAGQPIGCGGLQTLAPGIGEIKRMFVARRARRLGLGRRLLRELEARAAKAGLSRVRLMTTEVLNEACLLYATEGYELIERIPRKGRPVEIWLEKKLDA